MQSRLPGRVTGLAVLFLLLTVVATPASATDQRKPLPTLPNRPTATPAPTPGDGGSEPALVFDGVLAVRFMTADGTPLAGAVVIVKAFPAEGAAFAARERTNRSGIATFSGLPRPGSVAPFVWIVDAKLRVTRVSGRCTSVTEYAGSAEELATAGARAIPVFAERVTRSATCGTQPSAPRGGDNNAPRTGGDQPGRAGGGGTGGSALGSPGLTPPATSTEAPAGEGGGPVGGLILVLLAACGLILKLEPRVR